MYACILTAQPRLMEPIFTVDITVPREYVSKIYNVMTKRRGLVKTITPESNNVIMIVDANLPVANSFGFIDELREETSGTAFASMMFSHWQIIPDDPLVSGTLSNKIMLDVRKRKGRKVEAPKLEDYLDRL
jgi:elongation factor 2